VKTRVIELYHELRKIDPSPLFVKCIEEKKIDSKISHLSRHLGSALDESIKKIVMEVNHIHPPTAGWLTLYVDQSREDPLSYHFTNDKVKYFFRRQEEFNMDTYLEGYDFQSRFKYGISNDKQIELCQKHLNELLKQIDLEKLKAKSRYFTNLKISSYHRTPDDHNIYNGTTPFISGTADLILDNRMLDIKADITVNGRKTKYAAQIIFYYFLIKVYLERFKANHPKQHPPIQEIKRIGFYYAYHDLLIEVDVNKLIPNKDKIVDLIKHEMIYGNYCLKTIIEKSLLAKELEAAELEKLEAKVVERRDVLFATSDEKKIRFLEFKLKIHESALESYREEFEKGLSTKVWFDAVVANIGQEKIKTNIALNDAIRFALCVDLDISVIKDKIVNDLIEDKIDAETGIKVLEKLNEPDFRRLIILKKTYENQLEEGSAESKASLRTKLKEVNKKIKAITNL